MRILVLCYEFPPVGGGGGRVAEDLSRYFTLHGHHVMVATSGYKSLPSFENRYGFKIHRFFSFRKHQDRCTIFEMLLYVLTNIIPTLRITWQWKPDIIHCHFAVPTGFIASVLSFFTKIPYVITAHLGDVPGGVPDQTDKVFKIVKPFTTYIWKNAIARTAVSDYVNALAQKAYNVEVQTIFNGIEISSSSPTHSSCHNPVKLVFAGRFNPQKNLLFLIDVLYTIKDCNWTMDFAGDGELMQQAKMAVTEKGLSDKITFHGWLTPSDADSLLSKCDIFVLPSLYEGMPVVGIKALKFGLAIIASDIEGIHGILLHNVNGYYCTVNDTKAFANSIRQLINDTALLNKMKEQSLQHASTFDLSIISTTYENVFKKVVG